MAKIHHDETNDSEQIKTGPLGEEINDKYAKLPLGTAEEKPLEQEDSEKGYSTIPAQGKADVSLHLADEDRDRHQNPTKEATELQESYTQHEQQSDQQS